MGASFIIHRKWKEREEKDMNDYKEFYPTPEELVNKMLDGVNLNYVKTVLEPSAGKGDIVQGLKSHAKYQNLDIDCVEINKDLRNCLKGAGYRVVGDDFLTYTTMKQYDLIVMNPPFSNGDAHLLKALKMQQRYGGAVVALVNAETIRNPYTNLRKELVQLIENANGTVEYIEHAFSDAERQTDVEIALVKVKFQEPEHISSIMDKLQKEKAVEESDPEERQHLADNDFIKAIVEQYQMEIKAGCRLIEEYKAMQPYILSSFSQKNEKSMYDYNCILNLKIGDQKASVNGFIKEVREKYWSTLFTNPKFTGKLTSNVLDEYQSKIHELRDVEFSVFNILEVKWDMMQNVAKGIEQSIIDMFDLFCSGWFSEDMGTTIHYYNGWKTNSAYKVNKKAIARFDAFSNYGKEFDPIWSSYSYDGGCMKRLNDMEKCFNYLDNGRTSDGIGMEKILRAAVQNGQTRNIELKYFTVTFYKKGTCHIVFKDEELLKKFNLYGAQKKGWPPPSYGKKTYEEMEPEEKAVVEEFEGKEEYEKTLHNKDFYLVNENAFLIGMDKAV